jgi:hypothetical protein
MKWLRSVLLSGVMLREVVNDPIFNEHRWRQNEVEHRFELGLCANRAWECSSFKGHFRRAG